MGSIAGIGVDVVEIDRIRRVAERRGRRFLERVFTPEERARAAELVDPAPFLAGRFAAKEAVLKVLGTGLAGGITWRDVAVIREPSGRPVDRLSGCGADRARDLGIVEVLVSISHAGGIAVAQDVGVTAAGSP